MRTSMGNAPAFDTSWKQRRDKSQPGQALFRAAQASRNMTWTLIAVTSQFIGVAVGVGEVMLARFRDGAGTHYHHYDRFHAAMAEDSAQTVVAVMSDHILPLVPGLTERLRQGIDVMDDGFGGGPALLRLAEAIPNRRFTGIDLCERSTGA